MTTEQFLNLLEGFTARTPFRCIFNPWRDHDERMDADADSPRIRRENLKAFLEPRVGKARLILLAEAPGWRGCKFSGIPMTSERMILGRHHVIKAGEIPSYLGAGMSRTSSTSAPGLGNLVQQYGLTEPTATVVWGMVKEIRLPPQTITLWNAFAFHPHLEGDRCRNGTPSGEDVDRAAEVLHAYLDLFPDAAIVCIGGTAKRAVQRHVPGREIAGEVVHPSFGNATRFRSAIRPILENVR